MYKCDSSTPNEDCWYSTYRNFCKVGPGDKAIWHVALMLGRNAYTLWWCTFHKLSLCSYTLERQSKYYCMDFTPGFDVLRFKNLSLDVWRDWFYLGFGTQLLLAAIMACSLNLGRDAAHFGDVHSTISQTFLERQSKFRIDFLSKVYHCINPAPGFDVVHHMLVTRGLSWKKSRTLSAEIQTEKSTVKSRNPNWNPEINCEIQKSNLKSRNLFWNPEIHSEIRKSTLKSWNPIQDAIEYYANIRIPYIKARPTSMFCCSSPAGQNFAKKNFNLITWLN